MTTHTFPSAPEDGQRRATAKFLAEVERVIRDVRFLASFQMITENQARGYVSRALALTPEPDKDPQP